MDQHFKPILLVLLILILVSMTSCGLVRRIAEASKAGELPPVVVSNVAKAVNDEIPIVKTDKGYVPRPLPGVPVDPPTPLQYKTYIGVSN